MFKLILLCLSWTLVSFASPSSYCLFLWDEPCTTLQSFSSITLETCVVYNCQSGAGFRSFVAHSGGTYTEYFAANCQGTGSTIGDVPFSTCNRCTETISVHTSVTIGLCPLPVPAPVPIPAPVPVPIPAPTPAPATPCIYPYNNPTTCLATATQIPTQYFSCRPFFCRLNRYVIYYPTGVASVFTDSACAVFANNLTTNCTLCNDGNLASQRFTIAPCTVYVPPAPHPICSSAYTTSSCNSTANSEMVTSYDICLPHPCITDTWFVAYSTGLLLLYDSAVCTYWIATSTIGACQSCTNISNSYKVDNCSFVTTGLPDICTSNWQSGTCGLGTPETFTEASYSCNQKPCSPDYASYYIDTYSQRLRFFSDVYCFFPTTIPTAPFATCINCTGDVPTTTDYCNPQPVPIPLPSPVPVPVPVPVPSPIPAPAPVCDGSCAGLYSGSGCAVLTENVTTCCDVCTPLGPYWVKKLCSFGTERLYQDGSCSFTLALGSYPACTNYATDSVSFNILNQPCPITIPSPIPAPVPVPVPVPAPAPVCTGNCAGLFSGSGCAVLTANVTTCCDVCTPLGPYWVKKLCSFGTQRLYSTNTCSSTLALGTYPTCTDYPTDSVSFNILNSDCPILIPSPVPAPVPVPVPIPVPVPLPLPAPVPVPLPVPIPAPVPVPIPAPVPIPSPVPAPVPVPAPSTCNPICLFKFSGSNCVNSIGNTTLCCDVCTAIGGGIFARHNCATTGLTRYYTGISCAGGSGVEFNFSSCVNRVALGISGFTLNQDCSVAVPVPAPAPVPVPGTSKKHNHLYFMRETLANTAKRNALF